MYACIGWNYILPFCWLSSCIIENNSRPARAATRNRIDLTLLIDSWQSEISLCLFWHTRTPYCCELQLQQLASLCIWEWKWKWKWLNMGPLKYANVWWIAQGMGGHVNGSSEQLSTAGGMAKPFSKRFHFRIASSFIIAFSGSLFVQWQSITFIFLYATFWFGFLHREKYKKSDKYQLYKNPYNNNVC